MILRTSDPPQSAVVPCFLINVLDQVIFLSSSLFYRVVCVICTEARFVVN